MFSTLCILVYIEHGWNIPHADVINATHKTFGRTLYADPQKVCDLISRGSPPILPIRSGQYPFHHHEQAVFQGIVNVKDWLCSIQNKSQCKALKTRSRNWYPSWPRMGVRAITGIAVLSIPADWCTTHVWNFRTRKIPESIASLSARFQPRQSKSLHGCSSPFDSCCVEKLVEWDFSICI